MNVLIADDSSMWRTLLERHALSWGYEVIAVEDGKQAWEILQRENAPRIAILDWQMPGMDGIDVCRCVKSRENHPFTYVVMLSGRDSEEDIVSGLDAGADDYLTKPVQPAVLRSRLAAAKRIVELVPPKEWAKPRVAGYDVQRLLGKGGCATVWEAIQEATSRPVALKIIRVDLATEEVFSRFAREIQLMEKMDHPNIAQVYDSHIDHRIGYCAMELIEGTTLDKYVSQKHLPSNRILELIAQVCDGLEHAHQQGVLHRDLKPSNIMVTADGCPKLVDFGLGKSMFHVEEEAETGQTLDGSVIGTPLFMAPEQARGENETLDARTDIYAIGIVLYVLLVRRHPHEVDKKDQWQTIREIAEGHTRPPSEVHPDFDRALERVIMTAIASKPKHRYQSAAEFAAALREHAEQN